MTPIIFGSITSDAVVLNMDRISEARFDGTRAIIYYGTHPAIVIETPAHVQQLRDWIAARELQTRPPTLS